MEHMKCVRFWGADIGRAGIEGPVLGGQWFLLR
jgi:hypothetical protein